MENYAVYGAGVIGSGEATLITGHGLPCTVIGRSETGLERCRRVVEQNWDRKRSGGGEEQDSRHEAADRHQRPCRPGG